MDAHETRLKRLRYRAWHRGFREADLILGPFADKYASSLTPDQLEAFENLLEQPDHDLYAWIVGQAPTPPEIDNEIMSLIKVFKNESMASRGTTHGG